MNVELKNKQLHLRFGNLFQIKTKKVIIKLLTVKTLNEDLLNGVQMINNVASMMDIPIQTNFENL